MSRKNERNISNPPRNKPLKQDEILNKALEIADKEGIEAISMRRVAGELSVKAMSLYNHIRNKDHMIDGIVDLVISEFQIPDSKTEWKEAMRMRAESMHRALLKHPWVTMEIVSRINQGPNMFQFVDKTLGCLVQAGFDWITADHAWNAMDSHIYGYTLQELNFPFKEEDYSDAASEYMPLVLEEKYPNMRLLSQMVMNGSYDGIHSFSFGLNLLLEGLDRLRQKS